MAFKFEKLTIWATALNLTAEIGDVVKTFPAIELYSLSCQLRKASDSVVLNIAEGCTGQSDAEQRQFLKYSLRSAIEVVSCLFIARKKNYLAEDVFNKYYHEYEKLCKMINRFILSIVEKPKGHQI